MHNSGFDPDGLLQDAISLDKLAVAKRQLCCAVRMFLSNDDAVSIHTLVSAGYEVVRDLGKSRGRSDTILDSSLIPQEQRVGFVSGLRIPQNFFKHADRNPGGRIRFPYHMTQFFLQDAIRLYILLSGNVPREMQVFLFWFQLRFPELFCYEPVEEYLAELRGSATNARTFKLLARHLLLEADSAAAAITVGSSRLGRHRT